MKCSYQVKNEKGSGCVHFKKPYCTNPDSQLYRCPTWIARLKDLRDLDISYSQMRSWERCPYKWYLEQILGIRTQPQYTSIAMRMGSEFARLLSGQDKTPAYFGPHEQINRQIVRLFVDLIKEYDLLPSGLEWEVDIKRDGFHGILDFMVEKDGMFGEMKFTGSPDFYLNNIMARDQLEGYFYLNPKLKRAYMLPVRAPRLKDKKDEDSSNKIQRIAKDVRKRFNFYFPNYREDRLHPKWGEQFGRVEFDLNEFRKKLEWTKKEIQMACKANYFIQKTGNCTSPWKCDFLSVRESGNINWELFEKKERR